MLAHGTTKGAGFILTVYRRRLTSSWAAIRKTLTRRLDHEELLLDDDLLDEVDDEEIQTTPIRNDQPEPSATADCRRNC